MLWYGLPSALQSIVWPPFSDTAQVYYCQALGAFYSFDGRDVEKINSGHCFKFRCQRVWSTSRIQVLDKVGGLEQLTACRAWTFIPNLSYEPARVRRSRRTVYESHIVWTWRLGFIHLPILPSSTVPRLP